MMDYIKLKNMAFFGYHGDEPEEKTLGQRFYIDVVIGTDLSKVSRTDDLEVFQIVKRAAEGGPYKLLEKLAGVINEEVMGKFPQVEEIVTTVHKPGSPIPGILDDVSVTIKKER